MTALGRLLTKHPSRTHILVLLALALLAIGITGCGSPEKKVLGGKSSNAVPVKAKARAEPAYRIEIKSKTIEPQGTAIRVVMRLQIRRTSGPARDYAWITWNPPKDGEDYHIGSFYDEYWPGETNHRVDMDLDTGLSPEFTVSYVQHRALLEAKTSLVDTFRCGADAISVAHDVSGYNSGSQPLSSAHPVAESAAPQDEDYYLWRTMSLYYIQDLAMDTDLCQATTDFFQSGDTFFALRFPVQPPSLAYTEPYTLPLVLYDDYTPTLKLLRYDPFGYVVTHTLDYMPQYHTFLENELPAAPGEHWVALGPTSTPTLTCPQDLNIGANDWEFEVLADLDLGGEQDTCLGCNLPLYWCYRGEEAPFFLPTMTQAPGASLNSYQGWGTTCMGPISVRLGGGDLLLEGHHHGWVTPTEEVWFGHGVYNYTGQPISVTLDASSSLGLVWGIYSDTETFEPLADPIALGSESPQNRRLFVVHTTLADDTPMGPETVLLTAQGVSSPTLQAWASYVVWVGDWLAPPPPQGSSYLIHLPIVLR